MKIVFIHPNFYGIGGVEEATIGLADALHKKGHEVIMLSLKKAGNRKFPEGVQALRFYEEGDKSLKGKLKLMLHKSKNWYKELCVDSYIKNLIEPYAMYRLKKFLAATDADVVVTTRESLHPLLYKAKNENIKNKLYYFHIRPDTTSTVVPIVENVLKKYELETALFITDTLRQMVKNELGYDHYKNYVIMGNTINSEGIIEREKISPIEKADILQGCILTRFSPGKEQDFNNIIDAGHFLKKNADEKVIINVYGSGSLKGKFIERVKGENLEDILVFHPTAPTSWDAIAENDFVIDLSVEQGFGMIYIEAILAGKPVIATKNTGSREVLKSFPDYIFENYDEMLTKILSFPLLTKKELQRRYDIILKSYGPETLAMRFLSIISDNIII